MKVMQGRCVLYFEERMRPEPIEKLKFIDEDKGEMEP